MRHHSAALRPCGAAGTDSVSSLAVVERFGSPMPTHSKQRGVQKEEGDPVGSPSLLVLVYFFSVRFGSEV